MPILDSFQVVMLQISFSRFTMNELIIFLSNYKWKIWFWFFKDVSGNDFHQIHFFVQSYFK